MLEVLIIRPGCTMFDEAGRIKGSLDIPLSENGKAQAERLSLALQTQKLDCLYVGPCLSAQTTAQQIAERNFCKQRNLNWLQNMDHGLWQGKLLSEVKRLQPTFYRQFQENSAHICPPGGESVQEALLRIQAPLAKLVRKHTDGRIGILVPDPMASIVERCLMGGKIGDIWQLERDSGTFSTIQVQTPQLQPVLQIA
jgi:broad specificity phosphatase PhoE